MMTVRAGDVPRRSVREGPAGPQDACRRGRELAKRSVCIGFVEVNVTAFGQA